MLRATLTVLLFISASSVLAQCRSGCSGGGTRVIYQPSTSSQVRYTESQPVYYEQRHYSPSYTTRTEYVSRPEPVYYETRRVISQPSYSSQTYYSNPQPVYHQSPVVEYRQNPVRYETSGGSTCRSCQTY